MRSMIIALVASAACGASEQPAQRIVLSPAPPPGPWAEMRSALDACARAQGLAGDLEVRIGVGDLGKVITVNSAYGDAFATCVGTSLNTARYRDHSEQILAVAFTTP